MQVKNSTFLVTGGASGLGQGTVRRLARAGANVVIADLNTAAGQAMVDELGADKVVFQSTDVTSAESAQAAVDLAVQRYGGLQGLVNCAGILGASRVLGKEGPHDLALFRRVIEVNLIGTFNMIRLAATAMAQGQPNEEGERGVIVCTASVAAEEGQIGQAAYSASKGGVASMTLPIARELGKHGIRIVSIAPGVFETAMMQAAPTNVRDSLAAQIPFPSRYGRPDEFAQLVQQIAENTYFNGTMIRLDGAIRMGAK
ncbi:2,5-dichloro-2,5-cyclohexadiene-1,4-diol dehydrogenase [Anatilimnocola aggregata]|uniref:2,5-dichloro-2,5-cyclohexadiene-1,4-diol dehydrogenase n=1 Tax=Anatilimnocola aggregata TaxID=2528021 RepID=A0A517YJW5_9BACT|nr:SDR family NAD(P)-dependent oxidoreductase [Anatilimnocola aggregata]QDU30513.1 2,5-dichloro-2,5-cyclohexadiene-1,4-diol dehydrogenase [Anatilimnocola aggregata]